MPCFKAPTDNQVESAYQLAKERYAGMGVDTESAIERAVRIPISLHCWQADDVGGFETLPGVPGVTAGGGIMATGNYPGKPTSGDQMRDDLNKVLSLLPGEHRLNLHACYAETGGKAVDRNQYAPEHFAGWIDWAKQQRVGLDFNPTFFAHPKAEDGLTLSHPDDQVRRFWVEHGIACRRIAQAMATALGSPCVTNIWVPDGIKDSPADRWGPRQRLTDSLDKILDKTLGIDTARCVDTVESKLFGLGSEDYVVGSFEFYSHYALTRDLILCLDMGHFHPTETIHDKLSALLQFHKRLLLHVSRPIRWDSDHVVIFNDELKQVFLELARGNAVDRAIIALDFFDASINRLLAYVVGTRATRLAILNALLDPSAELKRLELAGKAGPKLAAMEAAKTLPFAAVWDMLCLRANVPVAAGWVKEIESYERDVQSKRG
jgi:L-rhamnose isomerase